LKLGIKRTVRKLLGPARTEALRRWLSFHGPCVPRAAYLRLIQESESCFRELLFPELPLREGRHELMANLLGTQIYEALYVLLYLHRSMPAAGDVCEFGVAQGSTSALLANEIRDSQKRLWLFDSFQGLPKPTSQDVLIHDDLRLGSIDRYQGQFACGVEEVKYRLQRIRFPLERVQIVPGFIEQTAQLAGLPAEVSFAYVDFDFYEPIKIALQLLDKRLTAGGVIVVDDYGYFSTGAKTAVDEFVAERGSKYALTLPQKFAGCFAILTRSR
jgi:O-methyltransferase